MNNENLGDQSGKDKPQPENNESQKPAASTCGSGCGCHATKSSGKIRMIVGAIVLIAAGILVVRAVIKKDESSSKTAESTFALPVEEQPTATPNVTVIGTFSELNIVAAKTDAVFVFLHGKEGTPGNPPSTAMMGAVGKIESRGLKCGLFTMKSGSPDYDKIASQMPLPGVLAMVKGRGMSAISGEITEEKLLQGYIAASRAGGCGAAATGCGPSGCK